MAVIARRVSIPADHPRVMLVVRIIDGCPVMFTEDGKMIAKSRGVNIHSRFNEVQSATLEVLIGEIEYGLPDANQTQDT